MKRAVLFALATILISEISGEIIPYSYASGRDVGAVERRYARFQEAKSRNASTDELNDICGPVSQTRATCAIAGRPSDAATQFCDTLCCLNGNKVGNCGPAKLSIRPNWGALLGALTEKYLSSALAAFNPSLAAGCSCSDDLRDVKCGPDGSFGRIRCPFDTSACWRKCCRDGSSGGRCRGFLRLSCRCY